MKNHLCQSLGHQFKIIELPLGAKAYHCKQCKYIFTTFSENYWFVQKTVKQQQ